MHKRCTFVNLSVLLQCLTIIQSRKETLVLALFTLGISYDAISFTDTYILPQVQYNCFNIYYPFYVWIHWNQVNWLCGKLTSYWNFIKNNYFANRLTGYSLQLLCRVAMWYAYIFLFINYLFIFRFVWIYDGVCEVYKNHHHNKLVMQLAMYTCTSLYLLARMHRITGHSLPVYKCCKIGNVTHLLIKKPSPTTEGYWALGVFEATVTDIIII